MNRTVSIIVPIYNVQNYVRRCLDSLLYQTYSDIEIIAVDDGSTDKCPNIIDEYKKKDNRIVTIHKENGGLSSARNAGLKICCGSYVLYVDGDDWLDENTVDILVNEADKYEADIVMFPYIKEYAGKSIGSALFDNNGKTFKSDSVSSYILSFLIGPGEHQDVYNPLLMDRLNTAWGKLYKRRAIAGIQFVDTQVIGVEDGLYNIQVVSYLSKHGGVIRYTEKTWYHYEKGNTTSLVHSYRSDYFNKRLRFYNEVESILVSINREDLVRNLNNRMVLELFGETVNLLFDKREIDNKAKYLRKVLQEERFREAFSEFDFRKLNLVWNIYFRLFKCKMTNTVLFVTKIILWIKA